MTKMENGRRRTGEDGKKTLLANGRRELRTEDGGRTGAKMLPLEPTLSISLLIAHVSMENDTGKHLPVTISVRDEEEPTQAANPQFRSYFAVLYLLALAFTSLFPLVPLFQNEKQSLLKAHGGFFVIMTLVSLLVAVVASGILICTSYYLQSWMRDTHYTILKSIGCFSAILTPFWFLAVLLVPNKLNWIVYSVMCVVFVGILVAYYFIWELVCAHQQDYEENNDYPTIHCAGFTFLLTPLATVLPSFLSLHVTYILMCVGLTVFVAYVRHIFLTLERLDAHNEPPQQDHKTVKHP